MSETADMLAASAAPMEQMRLRPTPVVMVSTLTVRGAEATLTALELGAVDCLAKPATGGPNAFDELAEKVKLAAQSRPRARPAACQGTAINHDATSGSGRHSTDRQPS